MFQLWKRAKRQQRCLSLLSFIRMHGLSALENCHIFSSTRRMRINIRYLPRQCLLKHIINTGLCWNSRQIHMLFAWSDHRLHDWILSVRNRLYLYKPALMTCQSIISWEFRHRISCMCILILNHSDPRLDFPFNHIFSICDCIFFYGNTWCQYHRSLSDGTRNRKFVIPKRCSWRFKAGTNFYRRINTDRNRNRKRLPEFCRPFCHHTDMSASRL